MNNISDTIWDFWTEANSAVGIESHYAIRRLVSSIEHEGFVNIIIDAFDESNYQR